MMRSYFPYALVTLALACVYRCQAFTIFHESKNLAQLCSMKRTQPADDNELLSCPQTSTPYNRAIFLQTLSLGLLSVVNIDTANAAGDESKGTKDDPKFQACMSKCVFECTKPKGEEQKSRSECIPECKTKCATTKEQLMTGRPLKKGD